MPENEIKVDPNQYEKPIGPERPANPTPSNPNPADQDSQQRKSEQFKKEQDEWNRQKLQQYVDEEREKKGREYEEEQEKIVKSRKEKTFGEKVVSSVKGKIDKYSQEREEERQAKRKGMLKRLEAGGKATPSPKPERKGKQSSGQFQTPRYGKSFADPFGGGGNARPFPNIDPFGGMGGGGNAMALPKAGPNMFNFGPAMPRQQQQRPQGQQRVPPPPPRPAPRPIHFPDPFAGISKGAGKGSSHGNPLAGFGKKSGDKGDPFKGFGKGMGIGPKTGKKLKKLDDWMRF